MMILDELVFHGAFGGEVGEEAEGEFVVLVEVLVREDDDLASETVTGRVHGGFKFPFGGFGAGRFLRVLAIDGGSILLDRCRD